LRLAATVVCNDGTKELRFGGVLSGGDVTFDAQNATTRYSIQFFQANTLAGANFVKGHATLELVKPANVAAIGGSLTVDGPNAQLIFFFNGQLAAGTVSATPTALQPPRAMYDSPAFRRKRHTSTGGQDTSVANLA
jgi:hypothetical protein